MLAKMAMIFRLICGHPLKGKAMIDNVFESKIFIFAKRMGLLNQLP